MGQTCRALPVDESENDKETERLPCDVDNNCSPYGECLWVESELRNKCVCNPQYEGNGYECTEVEVSCLDVSVLIYLFRRRNANHKISVIGKHLR